MRHQTRNLLDLRRISAPNPHQLGSRERQPRRSPAQMPRGSNQSSPVRDLSRQRDMLVANDLDAG
jgi:hypothetical protein